MVIVGNSHVTVFRDGCILPQRPSEDVRVQWLALSIDDFEFDNVRALRAREVFAKEPGWKFIMVNIGWRDTISVIKQARASGSFDEAVEGRLQLWRKHFTELNRAGNFAWMLGMMQVKDVPEDVTRDEYIQTSMELTARLTLWCREKGIPVINPLPGLGAEEGSPSPNLLMADREHLRPSCATAYFAEIETEIAEVVARKSEPARLPWPGEGMDTWQVSQAFEEIGIPVAPPNKQLPPAEFEALMCQFLTDKLSEQGLDFEIEPQTDFVAESLLDSLSLVELMEHATQMLEMDIPFDTTLWQLGTVRKLRRHLYARLPHARIVSGQSPPVQAAFAASMFLRGSEHFKTAFEAERQIARMGIRQVIGLYEYATDLMQLWSQYFPFFIPYWLGLAEFQLGREDWAHALLDKYVDYTWDHAPDLHARLTAQLNHLEQNRPPRFTLPEAKGFKMVLIPDGDEAVLASGLAAFYTAFGPEHDVSMHIVECTTEERLLNALGRIGEQKGLDLAVGPDIVLLAAPDVDPRMAIPEADLVLGSRDACDHARHLGRPAFEAPDESLLREAFVHFRELPWAQMLAADNPYTPWNGQLGMAVSMALDIQSRAPYLKAARILRELPPMAIVETGFLEPLEAL